MKVRSLSVLLAITLLTGVGCDNGRDRAPDDDEIRAMVDSMLPPLARLAALPALEPVVLERQSVDQVRAYVESKLEEEMPPAELEGIRITYTMLGLLPDTLRLRDLLLDLYTEQIAGYYDASTRRLYVVEGVPTAAVRTVVAHELVHALQDQHANLDSLIAKGRGNDRQTAAQAAIEGHATLVMFALLAEEIAGRPIDPASLPDPVEQLAGGFAGAAQFPVFERAPAIVRETLVFPYSAGASFVHAIWSADGGGAHTAPLGEALPQSTEQVMNPLTRFRGQRDVPTELRFDSARSWQVAYENTLGAFEVQLFLDEHLGRGSTSALGWDGDRFRLLETPTGSRALEWVVIWDDSASADRFRHDVERIRNDGYLGDRVLVEAIPVEGRPAVRIVVARDVDPSTLPVPAVYCVAESGAREPCAGSSAP
jgi:hypothetical protein